MGESFITRKGGNKLKNTISTILVEYPLDSKCTCTKGNTTLESNNATGIWAFGVPSAGTWTIASAVSGGIVEKEVSIEEGEILYVTIRDMIPSSYQQVEYIMSLGTRGYVNTQIVPYDIGTANLFSISLDCRRQSVPTDSKVCAWGNYSIVPPSAPKGSGIAGGYTDKELFSGYGTGDLNNYSFNIGSYLSLQQQVRAKIKWGFTPSPYIRVNDTAITLTSVTGGITMGNSPIILFAQDTLKTNGISNFEIYEAKIYTGETMIAHLQPCYRKSDGKIGFWDKVRDMFLPVSDDSAFVTNLDEFVTGDGDNGFTFG